MSNERMTGTVKWFDNAKGYGFIENEQDGDAMVHYRSIQMEGYKTLKEGQEVTFRQVRSEKGWQAAEVEVLETV